MKFQLFRHRDEIPAGVNLGGKARALALLAAGDLPIPEWIEVVPDPGNDSPDLPAEMRDEVVKAAQQEAPDARVFAVRSSAADEDGAEHSFAGQLDTFLFVPAAEIADKVEAVLRSGRSERIMAYRRERGLESRAPLPGVIVQRMIDAEMAGVAFAADPVSGRRGHAVVSAVRGTGDALVSGEVDADTVTVDREGRIVAKKSASGSADFVLSDDQARAVAGLVRATSRFFGRPQDIEWAYEKGRLWLLQSRPITSLGGVADPDGGLGLWDNANIAESYSGITTPLTFSFARGIYEAVYREFARLMGVRPERITANQDLFPRMLGLVRGRIYYNLISWYRLLALFPGFAINRGFMEQMMGVKEGLPDEVLAGFRAPGGWARVREGLALVRSCGGLAWNHLTLERQIERFHARLDLALRPPVPALEDLRPDELVAHYRDLERQLLLRWDAPLVNDFFAMIFYGLLRKLSGKWCADTDGTLQNDLLCGEGGMISAEPARRVRELASIAAGDPAGVATLCEGSLRQINDWLATAPEFKRRYDAYLERFGDRCLEELKLESLTLHDEPLTLLRSVGQFARRFAAQASEGGADTRLRAAAERRVAQSLSGHPGRRLAFGWVLKHARARVRDRENLRFERTRLFGRVRRIFVAIGRRLHAAGCLEEPRDVFHLTIEEIIGFVEGTSATTNLRGLAALRQAEFAGFGSQAAPDDRFATRGAVHLGNRFQGSARALAPTGEVLKGIGCCPGVVRARARVITDPRTAVIERGEILVAPRTDPGWIMLFPSAAGLLVEHGSLLSHSAIVAREMAIPAIVSIAGVTNWLKTGDLIEIDGAAGTVRKVVAA